MLHQFLRSAQVQQCLLQCAFCPWYSRHCPDKFCDGMVVWVCSGCCYPRLPPMYPCSFASDTVVVHHWNISQRVWRTSRSSRHLLEWRSQPRMRLWWRPSLRSATSALPRSRRGPYQTRNPCGSGGTSSLPFRAVSTYDSSDCFLNCDKNSSRHWFELRLQTATMIVCCFSTAQVLSMERRRSVWLSSCEWSQWLTFPARLCRTPSRVVPLAVVHWLSRAQLSVRLRFQDRVEKKTWGK